MLSKDNYSKTFKSLKSLFSSFFYSDKYLPVIEYLNDFNSEKFFNIESVIYQDIIEK